MGDLIDKIKASMEQTPQPKVEKVGVFDSTYTPSKYTMAALERRPENTLIDKVDLGVYGDPRKYEKYGVVLNPIDTDFDRQRAKNQGAGEQFVNMLAQAFGGELIGGTIEGFGALGDVISGAAFREGDDRDYQNALTRLGSSIRESIAEAAPIYQRDPAAMLDFGDFGYIMNRMPSVISSLSLLLPVAGTGKAISTIGRMTGATARMSRAGKAIQTAAKAGKYGKLRTGLIGAATPARLKAASIYAKQGLSAIGMRIGENYRESADTYERVREMAFNHISQLSDEEYMKWASETPELKGVDLNDKEAVANRIGSRAADRSFAINAGNVVWDFIQLRALSGMWKNAQSIASTYSLKEANRLGARTLGMAAEETAKAAAKTTKQKIGSALYRAIGGTRAAVWAELSEGAEEGLNFIAGEEGMLYGQQLLGQESTDSKWTDRVGKYLQNPEFYDSAVWGVIGGVTFHGIGSGFNTIKNKLSGNDDTSTKYRAAEISARKLKYQAAQNKMNDIESGKNPYVKATDENGEVILDNNKKAISKDIESEAEKEALRDRVERELITDLTLDAISVGNYDLLKDYINDSNIKQQLIEMGLTTEEDYDAYNTRINQTLESTLDSFKNYSALFESANVSDHYLNNIITHNIKTDTDMARIREDVANLQSQNDNIATVNEELTRLRHEGNLDDNVKAILASANIDYIKDKIIELENQTDEQGNKVPNIGKINNLRRKVALLEGLHKKYLAKLPYAERFANLTAEQINAEIDKDVANNKGMGIEDFFKTMTIKEFNRITEEVSNAYVDNLLSIMENELDLEYGNELKVKNNKEAEQSEKVYNEDIENKAKVAVDLAKESIRKNLALAEGEEWRKALKGAENANLTNVQKVIANSAREVLIKNMGREEYNKYIDAEAITAEKLRPPVEARTDEVPTKTEPETNPNTPVTPVQPTEQVVPTKPNEIVKNEEANTQAISIAKNLIATQYTIREPFTYRNMSVTEIEIIPGNYTTTMLLRDANENEIQISERELYDLVNKGNIVESNPLSTGEEVQSDTTESVDAVNDSEVSELESAISETNTRYQQIAGLVNAYTIAVGKPTIGGKLVVSIEDITRYLREGLGAKDARKILGEVTAVLRFLEEQGTVLITDNETIRAESTSQLLNRAKVTKEEKINAARAEETRGNRVQISMMPMATDRTLNTQQEIDDFNTLMNIKDGDELTLELEDNKLNITKDGVKIGELPTMNISSDGSFMITNELWNYNISLNPDGSNTHVSDFTNALIDILENPTSDNMDFLAYMEFIKGAINSENRQLTQQYMDFIKENETFKGLVSKFAASEVNANTAFKMINHINKLLGYTANISPTTQQALIVPTLHDWVNKIADSYANANVLASQAKNGNIRVKADSVTSGKLVKTKGKFGNVIDRTTTAKTDNFRLYIVDKGNIFQEGNISDVVPANGETPGTIIMYTKDSNDRKVRVHLNRNNLTGSLTSDNPVISKIRNAFTSQFNGAIDSFMNGDLAATKTVLDNLAKYFGSGKLLYGSKESAWSVIEQKNGAGYILGNPTGTRIFFNIGKTSIDSGRVSLKIEQGGKVVKDLNMFSSTHPSQPGHVTGFKQIVAKSLNEVGFNVSIAGIKQNGHPNIEFNKSTERTMFNDSNGRFNILLPTGELMSFSNYSDFLLYNDIIATDVDGVKDANGNVISNFAPTGQGVGFEKNIYLSMEVNPESPKPAQTKPIVDLNETARELISKGVTFRDLATNYGMTEYNSLFQLFDTLGISINPNIKSNKGRPGVNASFVTGTKTVNLFNNWFKLNTNDEKMRKLIHEVLHYHIDNMPNAVQFRYQFENVYNKFQAATEAQPDNAVKERMKLYLGKETNDRNVNIEEFIVESLTSKELIGYLSNIASDTTAVEGEGKSLFRKVLDLMAELFQSFYNIDNTLMGDINNILATYNESEISGIAAEVQTEIKSPVEAEAIAETKVEPIDKAVEDVNNFTEDIDSDLDPDAALPLFSTIDEVVPSMQSLRNRLSDYGKERFAAMDDAELIKFVCK